MARGINARIVSAACIDEAGAGGGDESQCLSFMPNHLVVIMLVRTAIDGDDELSQNGDYDCRKWAGMPPYF